MKIKSIKEMEMVAEKLLRNFSAIENNTKNIILLEGDLGSGKTTLVQNIGKVLKIKEKINSPTFVISKKYKIKNTEYPWKHLVHVDAYRLKNEKDLKNIGLDLEMKNKENIIFIEWPEIIKNGIPKNSQKIKLKYISDNKREIIF